MKKQNDYRVETYYPPKEIVELAIERTKGISRQWGSSTRNTLGELVVSAYLQGITDVAQALL